MTSTVYTPLLNGRVVELAGGLWRKRVLPVADVRYQGRILKFTKPYLQGLAEAFRQKAYDSVPVQMADADNKHTNAVERFAGTVVDADVDDGGLWITVRPTDPGEAILTENPALGVSARIVEGYDRSDGKFFPAAIHHVLLTHDPRIPQLGGWSVVEASNSADHVIDLSTCDWSSFDPDDMTPGELAELDQVVAGIDESASELERWCRSVSLSDVERQAAAEARLSNSYDLSNDYGGSTGRHIPTAEEREIARDMADAYAAQGDLAQATLLMEFANSPAGPGSDGYGGALELANAKITSAYATEPTRAQQDRAPLPRGFDDRLSGAFQRIQDETYLPNRSLAFSGGDDPGKITGTVNCGPSDPAGYCMNSGHSADCGSLAAPEVVEAYQAAGAFSRLAAQPVLDADGKAWATDGGEAAAWRDHLESLTGQRMSQNGFETGYGKPALTSIARLPAFGDYDDADGGDRVSAPMPHATLAMAAAARDQSGEFPRSRSAAEIGLEKVAERMLMQPGHYQTSARPHPDLHGESPRERAARMHRPVTSAQLVQVGDTWNGSQPSFTTAGSAPQEEMWP